MRALLILSLRQMLGGKKIWILGVFLSLPILLLAVILIASGFDFPENESIDVEGYAMSAFLYIMYPQSLCILASLLYGASLLAGEIEDKTLTYLFTRAMPRWKVLLGKYVATAASLAVATTASMSVAFVLCGMPIGVKVWFTLATTITCACFTYTALFCLLGLFVPRRAIPIGLIYAVVVEGFLSAVPAVVNELTASYYLRSMGWHLADLPLPAEIQEEFDREVAPFVAGADVPSALMALGVISVVALSVSAWVIHRREWPLTEGV
ncbi:MAG: ABC-type transport system involved in multi-copper enzyme maturation permease subunit [Planctomycetota bacterium]|jgi:ABC-type transport system involved in multi-copper enzyme maturation permease subunit